MENKFEIFKNEEFGEVRSLEKKGELYFVGNDVAKILGYQNTRDALSKHVDDEDKIPNVAVCDGTQNRKMTIINESGLYSLILSSKLPTAKKFKHWVTSEVLPTLRKHKGYLTNNKIEEILNNPDTIIKLAMDLKNERQDKERLQLENMQKQQIIKELQPKADYTDIILQSKYTVAITAIAKDYGISGQAMNDKLHELGVQYKVGSQWLLYAKYQDCGYTHSKTIPIKHKSTGITEPKMYTEWTQKGRLFLYELLKSNGLLPMIEREN